MGLRESSTAKANLASASPHGQRFPWPRPAHEALPSTIGQNVQNPRKHVGGNPSGLLVQQSASLLHGSL